MGTTTVTSGNIVTNMGLLVYSWTVDFPGSPARGHQTVHDFSYFFHYAQVFQLDIRPQ